MKKLCALTVVMLLSLPGCGGMGGYGKTTKKSDKTTKKGKKVAFQSDVDIPVMAEDIKSRFDDELNEFALVEDEAIDAQWETEGYSSRALEAATADAVDQSDDFSWVVEDAVEKEESFKNVYFDFDADGIREDQEECVNRDIEKAKRMIVADESAKVTIEGNSCSSAGSRIYNLAKSNSRAQVVADRFVANGIPRENISIVGRGQDNPSLDKEGNPVMGGRADQWANRRVEVKVYA